VLRSGGVDGTRTRDLRRDRQHRVGAVHNRPRKTGVDCDTAWSSEAQKRIVSGKLYTFLARECFDRPVPDSTRPEEVRFRRQSLDPILLQAAVGCN
jgi:hypothetical protein